MYYLTHKTDVGLMFHALRSNEDSAVSLGVSVAKYRLLAMLVSGFFAGLAGSFWSIYTGVVNPWFFTVIPLTATCVMMGILGGMTTIVGPVLAAYLLTLVGEYLRIIMDLRLILYSVIVIVIYLYFPGGIMGLIRRSRRPVG